MSTNNKPQIIANINFGGIGDSEFMGGSNSVFLTRNLDIHSEPGIMKCNQKTKIAFNPASQVVAIVAGSDGVMYFFAKNGKIYLESGEQFSDVSAEIHDAIEFDGYLYVSTYIKLFRCTLGESTFTELDGSELTGGVPHPMHAQNLVLYIGEGNNIAAVESVYTELTDIPTHTFTAVALDIQKNFIITAIGQLGDSLVVGANKKGLSVISRIFLWNTWSESWSYSDDVPEDGINAFLSVDNMVLVQAGTKGNIYSYDGNTMSVVKRIPGVWSGNNGAKVYKNANTNWYGMPLFGVSNISGNPMGQGVYSFGAWSKSYPSVLNHEYEISNNETSGVIIYALCAIKNNLFISWEHNGMYGVDEIDWENKAIGKIETLRTGISRIDQTNIGIEIPYRRCGGDIEVSVIENGIKKRLIETTHDRKRLKISSKGSISECTTMRICVDMVPEGNSCPEIEMIIVK